MSCPDRSPLHLTFAFSAAGLGVSVLGLLGTGAYLTDELSHEIDRESNHTRRGLELEPEDLNYVVPLPVSKREPVSEDEVSDSLS